MSIKGRLALRLAIGFVLAGLVLLAFAAATLGWTINQLTRIEASRQFENAGLSELIRTIEHQDGQLRFDPKLIELLRESGGWLQRIDGEGRVTDSFFVPDDVPDAYGPGELNAYWHGTAPFPYRLYLWIQEKEGISHTLLYGMSNRDDDLLRLAADTAVVDGRKLLLPDEARSAMAGRSAWLQLLDRNGTELASYNKPPGAIGEFSIEELTLRSAYPDRYDTKLVSRYEPATGRTWVLSFPMNEATPGQASALPPEIRVLAIGIGALLLAALLLFVLVSSWFGHRFGSPIAHILDWLRHLGSGRYAEPADSTGVPRSRDKRGRRKSKYRVYRDVIDSMGALTATLHRNEKLREETERMRDEWIAGVSHDLKTPLSSIKGYAHLLENEAYEWSPDEIRSFARIMMEKSAHLDELVNDLSLVYRVKNGQGAPSSERLDLNAFMAEAIGEAADDPQFPKGSIRYAGTKDPAHIDGYRPWLQRIVDNLVANALQHNDEGTVLTVSLARDDSKRATLVFSDNGGGLDEETAERLFERYYRGTDTESRTEGSGLGMAVAKALVEGMGGSIEASSSPGQGTAIIVRWPLAS
ncbi:sensor histidine kinase [Paenibacillaceae bacterium WGS1546]|uniref:sensor histidine kinase n=1 Tax=Cohnella sp. WGS1546 TaxID=3366810 RepID=UPI00372D1182